jgi:hypothetical protein
VLGHSERRQYFGETDRAVALKVPAALEAGLAADPLRRRDRGGALAGDTERKLRHQVQEGLEHVPRERLAEVAIAYEPIWAIGTGRVATRRAGAGGGELRARARRGAGRGAASGVRVLYGGSVNPEQRRRAARAAGRRRGARRRRVAGRRSPSPRSRPRARRRDDAAARTASAAGAEPLPDRARRLGDRAARPRQRGLARAHAGVRRALGDLPAHPADACGRAVGLPEGQMGNSEVGHLNLGAGAVMRQDLTRIDDAIATARSARTSDPRAALAGPGRVHLIGLVSDGGVHSSEAHLLALIDIARGLGPARSSCTLHRRPRHRCPHAGLEAVEAPGGNRRAVGSVVGRYWAMDRDRRWDRTQKAYDLLVRAQAPHQRAERSRRCAEAYERGETDEFIEPTLVGHGRADRARRQRLLLQLPPRPDA